MHKKALALMNATRRCSRLESADGAKALARVLFSLLVPSLHSPDQQLTNVGTTARPPKREIFLTVISNMGKRRS